MAIKKKTTKKQRETEKYTGPKVILITGAAGYVGAMLCDQFSLCCELDEIIAIDVKPEPELLKGNKKITWITSELSEGEWEKEIKNKKPEVVIHCAWHISEIYGERETQRKYNIEASSRVFDFVFSSPTIKKLIYFSSVSAYGALEDNSINRLFLEGDRLREVEYLYGAEKKEAESILAKKYSASDRTKNIYILRPASIMGPRANNDIQKKGLIYILKNVLPFIPVSNDEWGRQYVHEDDITNIVGILTFNNAPLKGYEVFNLSPEEIILASDMAKIFKKNTIFVPPIFVRVAFSLAWNFTQGLVPTGKGSWRYYCYPLFTDGSKVSRVLKYKYIYSSKDTLCGNSGRYKKTIEEGKSEEALGDTELLLDKN